MHICFIVDNSLTMLQKTSTQQMTFFDNAKFCLESVIKTLYRNVNNDPQQMKDLIHLFVTSSTEPISSHQQNNQMHLIHQVKNLECTIPTFSAQVIESALYHLGKFKCLNQTETFLGYRQGTIFQPAIIFYITDNSNIRQISKMHLKVAQNKLQMRSQYKFITIKYCSVSPNEANLNNQQKFKTHIQKQKQSLMTEQLMKKINGSLYHIYQPQQMVSLIQTNILKFNPTLSMQVQSKDYKIYNKQILKIQFHTVQSEMAYLEKLRSLSQPGLASIVNSGDENSTFFIETIPQARLTQIPLPFQITPKHLNQHTTIIDQFQNLKFCVDFTKQYVGEVDSLMKVLFNEYQILQKKPLQMISKQFSQQKKFPLFYERKKSQHLVGYLRLAYPSIAHPNKTTRKPWFQLHISFSNFLNLNSNIRSFKQRHPSSEQYFQNYISTLPIYYHKFLRHYLHSLKINLSPQTQQLFQNINVKAIGVTNLRFYQQRMAEKKVLQLAQKRSYEQHQNDQSYCCSLYSKAFGLWEQERSQSYLKGSCQVVSQEQSEVNSLLLGDLAKLQQIKKSLGIFDYLSVNQIQSTSMKKQQDKYRIRRNSDQVDEFVGDILGNPFKKINKKVKFNDQADSFWVQPEQVNEMKQLIQKQTKLYEHMSTVLKNHEQLPHDLRMKSPYDQIVQVKQNLTKCLQIAKENHQLPFQVAQGKNQTSKSLQTQIRIWQQNVTQQLTSQVRSVQEQGQNCLGYRQGVGQRVQGQEIQVDQLQIQNIPTEKYAKSHFLEIIEQTNSKFKMNKSSQFQIPSNLLCNDLYLKNKGIFNQIIKGISHPTAFK